MMAMPITRIWRPGFTGLIESRIEIIDIIPPYWLIAITDSRPINRPRVAIQPKPPNRLSPAALKACTGVASGPAAADITAPSTNTQIADSPLGR